MNKENNDHQVTPFAITNYRDSCQTFGIRQKDRGGHMYIVGKTGTGKSTLLENLIYSDIRAGEGFALIDPHGDLAEKVLSVITKERVQDVIYFNPADIEYPIAFNPLEKTHPDHHHLVASGLISVFKKLWSEFWGPRMEHILRNSIMALLEYPNSTLVDIPRLLTDDSFRKEVVLMLKNQQVKDFWLQEFDKYSKSYKADESSPILNKIGQFLTTLPIRNIVAQNKSSFDLREVMDQKKILVVNLSKGKIGEDSTALLGAMLVTKL
ncbi:type IV secretion system DNA-binding domain-containing protein, partial [Candidatus Nomurabacteria bacterium]|nr:type IV secretion system DNA-binding domain-containing protein [Candidatus Nomurabacteria bacterium]